jgi:hypothetical protein
MRFLPKVAVLAAAYGVYRLMIGKRSMSDLAAFAPGEGNAAGFSQVRNAGPAAMRSASPDWDEVDEASDESFPASDPPAKY